MGALTKADMAEKLYEELGLNKREAKEIVEMFFEEIRTALEKGSQVKLSGFGNFDLRDKNQRPGRNPKTGEETAAGSVTGGEFAFPKPPIFQDWVLVMERE